MSLFDPIERFASWCGATVRENFKAVVVLALGAWLAVMFDLISVPNLTIPLWARVVGTFGAVAVAGGYAAAAIEFDDVEPDWNFVVEFNFDDPRTPRITRATDAVIQDMVVVGGRLRQPQGNSRIYVCRWWNRDTENPVAHCVWSELPDDTDLLGAKPSVIEDRIAALRDSYEETHGKFQWVLDHLFMVVRTLDFRRSKSQNEVFEQHATPSMDETPIRDVVEDIVPEELQPDQFDAPDPEDDGEREPAGSDAAADAVEDAMEDESAATGGTTPAQRPTATDGGLADE